MTRCVECNKVYKTHYDFKRHMYRHGPKNGICNQCGMIISTYSPLFAEHLRVCKGEKMFMNVDVVLQHGYTMMSRTKSKKPCGIAHANNGH